MEKKFSYNLMLSLKEISFRRIVVLLWTQTEILESLDVKNIHLEVEANTKKLGLPPLLTKQMKYLVRPIESEIRNWRYFHGEYLSSLSKSVQLLYLQHLCWTNLGTVDCRKMAEKIIRFKLLDIVQRYQLACFYCLEDSIPDLWQQLPEESKRYFYKEEGTESGNLLKFQFCWPYILKGESSKLDHMPTPGFDRPTKFNCYAFEHSALEFNKEATEYFLKRLTFVERETLLLRTAEKFENHRMTYTVTYAHSDEELESLNQKISNTFFYLLSQMTSEQQMEMFKRKPIYILSCLLAWPFHDIFVATAEYIWNFLREEHYFDLLSEISWKINNGYMGVNVFLEIFLQSPSSFKKQFVDQECRFISIFKHLFEAQDLETIKIIFRNVDSADRKRLVFSRPIFYIFSDYVDRSEGNLSLVELCLQEATLSNESKSELKAEFERFFGYRKDSKSQKLLRLFD